jgi:hypothetical protein
MKKFLVLYKMPLSGLDAWMAKTPEERKPMEDDLKVKMDKWMMENKSSVIEFGGAGKTKLVNTSGASDSRNEIMMYAIVEGEDQETVTQMFVGNPHLEIPEASIEVTAMNKMV